jgi:nucleoside-diphosphate-sugar epimerase
VIVAITGATGFIGKRLVQRHLAQGNTVRYLTRGHSSGLGDALPYIADLREPSDTLHRFLDGVDVVYHLAAELHDESKMRMVNLEGTRKLLESLPAKDKPLWIQLSSTGVYGAKGDLSVDEDTLACPKNPYELTKFEADELVKEFSSRVGLRAFILRPSTVYGPDMPNQSVFQLISMIDKGLFFFIGKPGAIANYIHVENVVDILMHTAAKSPLHGIATYIVSDHCTLEELVSIITKTLGKGMPRMRVPEPLARMAAGLGDVIPGFPLTQTRIDALTNRTCYQSIRLKEDYGYQNRLSMEDGFKDMVVTWKKSHG